MMSRGVSWYDLRNATSYIVEGLNHTTKEAWSYAGLTVDAELLARSEYSEGPATGHLDTVFSCFSLCL